MGLEELSSEEFEKHIKEMNEACTNGTLRQRDTFNDQYMGMPGTFQTLSLDWYYKPTPSKKRNLLSFEFSSN